MNTFLTSAASIAILSLTSLACNKTSTQTNSQALTAKASEASEGADTVKSCLGTEPFWNLQISKENLSMEILGEDQKISVAHSGPTAAVGTQAAFMSMYQGTLSDKGTFSAIVMRNECSDFMSDEIYPYSVSIVKGNSLYRGCCR